MPNLKIKWNAAHLAKECVAINDERTEWSFENVQGLVLDCTAGGGRPRGEAEILQAAALMEEALGLAGRLPIAPRVGTAPVA